MEKSTRERERVLLREQAKEEAVLLTMNQVVLVCILKYQSLLITVCVAGCDRKTRLSASYATCNDK